MYINKTYLGYYSYMIENPSSAINDGYFSVDIFIAALECYNESAGTVHVTMQGQDDKNVYSLETSEGKHTSGGNQLKTSVLSIIPIFMLFINFFF